MRREWPSLLVLLGLAFFAWLAVSPAFETGLVTVAIGACVILARTRDVRTELSATRGSRALLVYAPLVALGAFVTAPSWGAERPFVGLDGQVNLAIIGELIDQERTGHPLTWLTRIAPGDPMLDLYPTLAHRAIAWLAILSGHARDPARVLVVVVSAAYVAVSLGIARTAFRLGAPEPAALAVGAFALLDLGSDFTWGTRPVFHYGFLPSTISVAITLHTLPSMFDLLRRARWPEAIGCTLGFALAAATHPIALIVSLAIVAVLATTFALARPPRRRALVAPLAAASLGILGSAWLWLPASQRVLAYAVHYGTPQIPLGLALERMALGRLPDGGWLALTALAWVAGIAAFVRRDAREARLVALLSGLLVLSYVDTAFLELGLAPSLASVRWQAFRVGAAVKPFVYVLGALAITMAGRLPLALAPPGRPRAALRVAAVVGIALLTALGHSRWAVGLRQLDARRAADMTSHEQTSPEGMAALRYHLAREQSRSPGGRLLLVCGLTCAWELYELARDPGIPMALSQPAPAGFLLRDQLRTLTDENLRRFGVRWVVTPYAELVRGDPSTELRFDRLTLREVPGWDGEIAHVTRGTGRVSARTVPGRGFDLTLTGTDEPAFVELGTPYYERLEAAHEGGASVPVFALPVTTPEADDPRPTIEHAVALWLRPGTTRVRASGSLRSDASGLGPSVVAIAIAAMLVGSPRARRRARAWTERAIASRALRPVTAGAAVLGAVLLVGATWLGPADSLRFGVLLPRPRVFVAGRAGSEPCVALELGRRYACPDGATLAMTISYTLSDWHVGWPVPAPSVEVRSARPENRYVLELPGQHLEGGYLAQCEGCVLTLRDPASAESAVRVDEETTRFSTFVESPQLELRALEPTVQVTLLSSRFVDPPFDPPLPPGTPP